MNPSDHWQRFGKLGRFRWLINVYRHHYSDGSHRWVVQPSVHWDVRPDA